MLWSAVDLALPVWHVDLETVSCFFEEGHFFGNHVESFNLLVIEFDILYDHTLVVDGHLFDGGVTSVGGEQSCAFGFPEYFSLSD